MAKSVQLPDGSWFPLREGEDPRAALSEAAKLYPDAFGIKPKEEKEGVKRDTTGFKAAASAGFERLGGEFELLKGKLGIKDEAEAQKEYEAAQKRAEERFTPTQEGWSESPWQKLKETAGGSVPYVIAPAAAGLAALAAPVSAPVATALGLGAAGLTSAGQFTGSNLGAQMDTGKSLEEASLGKAVAAAIPQALLDTAAMALVPGVGKLFGSVGSKLTTAEAKAIAEQTLKQTALDYAKTTGATMGREGFTEAAQQVFERLQAGLDITDADARKDYIENFIGGAALAGVLGPVGRFTERGAAKDQAAKAISEEKAAARKAELLQQEQAAAAAEAEKNTPEYALRIADEYAAAQQKNDELKAQIHKGAPNKPLTEEQKAFNRETNKQLADLYPTLTELGAEKNRVTQSGLLAQAQEQQRRETLSPMDYMLEGAQNVPEGIAATTADTALEDAGLAFPEPITPTMRREAQAAQAAQIPGAYAAERMQLARDQVVDPTGDDYVSYLLQDPYKAALVVETRTPLPGLKDSESNMLRNAVARQLKSMSKEELAQRQEALKTQVPGKVQGNPFEQFLADQDMLDIARQEGMTESEIAKIESMARMPRDVVEQGDLFGEQQVGKATYGAGTQGLVAQMADLQRQLDIARVQRNQGKGGQYRETINGLLEQMQALHDQLKAPAVSERGQETAGLQEAFGSRFPQSLAAQNEAQAARAEALTKVANNDEEARFDVLNNLVEEIKAVRGELKPETITQIENDAKPLLDILQKYGEGYVGDVSGELDAISNKWRAGVERGATFTREATPTETTPAMLRDQMDVAFANRERYDAPTIGLLERIADNFAAVAVNPERRNLIGEWLHRATVTGKPSPEITAELRDSLDTLEQGKLQDNGQLELPASMLPKAVRGESKTTVEGGKAVFAEPGELAAPAKKATTFDTPAEFQKYLASEGLQVLRSSMGMVTNTASRIHERMGVFRKKYENIVNVARARIQVLNERKQALEKQKDTESRAAKELLADAQIRLNNVQERLDAELQELQVAFLEADKQAGLSAQEAADISAQIAANVAKFDQADAAAVEAAQATAAAKADLAKIMQQTVSKKTFSAMRAAHQVVIEKLRAQRAIPGTATSRIKAFLNADLELQMKLTDALAKQEADARVLVEATQALTTEAAKQKRRVLYKKEFLNAQKGLAAALELSGPELAKINGSIDMELAQIDSDINTALADARVAEGKLAPKEAPKSEFEKRLAEVKLEPLTRAEQDAITARDKADLERFQATTARLAAIPGIRIEAEQRREMWRVIEDEKRTRAELEAKIEQNNVGLEEMEIAVALAEDAIDAEKARIEETTNAPAPAKIYAEQDAAQRAATIEAAQKKITELEKKRDAAAKNVASLQGAATRLQREKANFEKAYARAYRATSNDPELYTQITADIDKRIEKLNKNIAENEERIAKGKAKSGKKAETKTVAQARKRLAGYKRDLKQLEALRANRFGITRIDAVTGETIAAQTAAEKRTEQGKAAPQKRVDIQTQEEIDAEKDRAAKYGERNTRLLELQLAQTALESATEPKSAAKKAERAERLRKLQEDINKQIDLVNEVRPKGMGKISAAARVQSSAPGKFRTGTAESKETVGVTKQPITEKREVAAPTAAKAVEEANEFATRLEKARTAQEREDLIFAKTLDERKQLVDAANANARAMRIRIAALEEERKGLVGTKSVVGTDRLKKIDQDLNGIRDKSGEPLTMGLRDMLKQLDKVATEVNKANEVEADRVFDLQGTDMRGDAQTTSAKGFWDEDFDIGDVAFRTSTKTGPALETAAVERLSKRITEGWKNAPEIVVVATERQLPVRILNQVERDNMWGKMPGLYDPKSKKVYLVASNLRDAADVIATVAHEAAGHFGLQSMLGATYSNMMRSIYANNSGVRSKAKAKMQANPNLSQDTAVEEVLADMAEGDLTPIERNIMQRVFDVIRNALRKLIGKEAVLTDNAVKQIVANARKFVIEGGVAGEGQAQTGDATYRTAKTADTALTDLASKVVATPKTIKEKIKDIKALELEMAGVDARAALDEVIKRGATALGDDKMYTQAMSLVRKRDDLLSQVSAVMENGPLTLYKDDKGFLGVRTSGKNSARDVFKAVEKIPAGSAQDKFALATTYLTALRVADKGLEKLDVGALGIKQADLDAAKAAVEADPAMRDAMKDVARSYRAYNNGLIKFLAETGAVTKKMADELMRGDYVPFYRVRPNGIAELVFSDKMVFTVGDIRNQPYLAELKGGEDKIMPLNESLPRNTMLLVDKALTNLAERNVAYALQDIGKGKGPVDPKTGKPKDLMPIHKETSKASPDDARVIRFSQEPDPRDPKDDGRRWLMVESEGTAIEGVPAALVVKSLEGASLPLPSFLKLASEASNLLRTGVTRTPMYIARQLYKEPMAATFTGGLNYSPFRAVLEAGKEYIRMMRGTSETQAKLIEKGLVQSQIFSGSPDDLKKIALQLARGGDQSTINKVFGALDRAAINADSATRALIYNNARKNGLSEVEAELMAREYMNFSKRGSNAAVQYASRLIPFMNAQIQGLNVLYKAMTGQMPFEEQLRIKRKFMNNAMLLFATGIVYAMAMEDDEYFRNARPRDKYTNFFLHLPGVEEPLKIATPFEAGYFFSLAVAAVDGMRRETDNAAQFAALRDMFLSSIPGYSSAGLPQIVKPVFEVWTNKNFLSGAPIESQRLRNLETAERYTESTTELAKAISRAIPILSPVQIEHIVRGYLGMAPIAAAAMINGAVPTPERGERPTMRASELPFFGSSFQRKMGGAQADEVYDLAEAAFQARDTYNNRLKTGRPQEAKEFREERRVELAMASAAGQYRQLVGRLNADIRRTQNRTDLSGDEKRARLNRLEDAKTDAATKFLQRYRDTENRLGD